MAHDNGPGVARGTSAPELSVPGFVALLKDEDLNTGSFAQQMSQLQLEYKHLTDDEHDAFYDMNNGPLMAEFAEAIVKRIVMMDDEGSDVAEQTKAVQSILRIMPYSGVRDALAKNLVQSQYARALVLVMTDVLDQPETEQDVEMQELLILIFQSMGDLCSSQWKEPSQRKPINGRDVLGPVFLEPLLSHICKTRNLSTGVRRAATDTLLKLIVRSRRNQADLLAYDQLCDYLFNEFLASCGDYNAQLDIMEILYRSAKSGHAYAVDRFIKNAQVCDLLKRMLSKQGVQVDLAQELRPVLIAFNSSLPWPTVSSFKAISISFDLPRIIPASDWVDVGSTQLMFHVKIDDLQGNPIEEIPEEPLDFHFGKMKRAVVMDDEEHADAVVIDMELSEVPRELIGVCTQLTTQTRSTGLRATVRAHKATAVPLLKHLPRNQLQIESQAEELYDLSQPRRHGRIAMAIHVYHEEPFDQPSSAARPSVAPSAHAHPSLDPLPHTPPALATVQAREEAQLQRQQQREQALKETQVVPGLGADSDLEARSEEELKEAAAAAAAAGEQKGKGGRARQEGALGDLTESQAEEAALQGIQDIMRDAEGRAPAPAAPAAPVAKGRATRSQTQSHQQQLYFEQQQQQRAASQANGGKGRKVGSQNKQPSKPLRQSPRHQSQMQQESQKQQAQEHEREQQIQEKQVQEREQQKQEKQRERQEQQRQEKQRERQEQQRQEKQRQRQEQQEQRRAQRQQEEEEEKEQKRAQEQNKSLRAPEDEGQEVEPISYRTRHAESSAQKKAEQAKEAQAADGRLKAGKADEITLQDGGGGEAGGVAQDDEDPAWLREGPVKAAAGAAPAPSATRTTNQSASLLAKGTTPGAHKTFAGRSRREQTSVERVSPVSELEEPAGAAGVRKTVLTSPGTAPRAAAAAATPTRGASRFAALATPTPGGSSACKDTTARGAAAVSPPAAAAGAQLPHTGAAATAEAAPKPTTAPKAKAPTTAKAAAAAAGRRVSGREVTAALLPNGRVGKPPRPRAGRTPKAAARKAPTPPRSVLYSDEPSRSGGRRRSGGVGKKSGAGWRRGAGVWGAGRGLASQSLSADAIEDPDLSMRDLLPPAQRQKQQQQAQPSAAAGLAAAAAMAGAKIGAVAKEAAGVAEEFDFGVGAAGEPGGDLRAGFSEDEEEGARQAAPGEVRGAKKAAPQQEPPPAPAAAARQPRAASSKARQAIRAQVESPCAVRAPAQPPQEPTTQQPDRRLPQAQAPKPKPAKPAQPTTAPPVPTPEAAARAAEYAAIDGEAMVEEEEDLQINEVHALGYDAVDVHVHQQRTEQHKPAAAAAAAAAVPPPEPLTGTAPPRQHQRFGDVLGGFRVGATTTPPTGGGTSTGLRLPRLLNFDLLGDEQERAAGVGRGGLGAEAAGDEGGMDEEEGMEGNGGPFQGIGGGTKHLEEALPGLGGGKRQRQPLQPTQQFPEKRAHTVAAAAARPAAGAKEAGRAAAGGLGPLPKLPSSAPFGGFDLAGLAAGAPSATPSPFEPQAYATTESPPEGSESGLAAPYHMAPLPPLDLHLPGLDGGVVGLGLGARGGGLGGPTRGAATARAAAAAPAAPAKRKAGTGRKGGAARDGSQLFTPPILSPESQEGEDAGTEGILMAQLMRMLGTPGDEDEEEREEGDEEIEAIKVLMTRMMESRRLAKRQKQTHLLNEAQERVAVGAQELEAAVQKEIRDHANLVRSTIGGLSAQMDQKFKAIQVMQEHFMTQLATAWDEYAGIYSQLDAAQQEMEALTDKRRAAAKRKVSSLDSGAASLLAEVAEKLDKMGKSKRLPKGLRNALQALL